MHSNTAVINDVPIPRKIIPSILIAMSIVIITEIMFFGGLISAYIIANARAVDWPPIDQPRLPQILSISNLLILIASGVFLYLFNKNSLKGIVKKSFLLVSIILAVVFLLIQGSEWVNLVNFGMRSSTGLYASYFYSLIAIHGLHVLVGLLLLVKLYFNLKSNSQVLEKQDTIKAFSVFWYFVVILWPILYFLLYLL